jgi:hypothetical protein
MATRTLVASWIMGIAIAAAAPAASAEDRARATAAADVDKQLDRKLAASEREVVRLREAGAADKARDLAAQAAHFRDRLTNKAAPAPALANEPEVHVVGLYQGTTPVVDLRITDRPIILILCAYEPVTWDLRIARNVRLERVILGGYHAQSLAAVAAGELPALKVDVYTHDTHSRDYFYAYRKDADGYAQAERTMRKLAGRDLATFQGEYEYAGNPFVLAPADPAFQAQRVLAELEPVYRAATAHEREQQAVALRRLRFTAVTYANVGPGRIVARVGEFSPLGPVDEAKRVDLPQGMNRVAIDPPNAARKDAMYYGIAGRSAAVRTDLKVDPATNQVQPTKLDLPAELPKLSWPCGMAFDTKRHRAVMTSLGGVGHMYAYDVATGTWSLLGDMNNVDLDAFTYSAKEDCYYGLATRFGGDRRAAIIRYDATGKPRGAIELPIRLTDGIARDFIPTQLLALDGAFAIVLPAEGVDPVRGPIGPMRCIVADAKTGAVTYEGEFKPPAEQPGREKPAR